LKLMNEDKHEYVSINEFARRVGVQKANVIYAIKRGRIVLSGKMDGRAKLIDWTTQEGAWKTNRLRDTETGRRNRMSKEGKTKKKDWDKLEKHIGDATVYETGQMGIDPSTSRFDDIPEIDGIQAPVGSVAYYQAKKLAVDALRNLYKLKLETAQLISVPDATALYCDVLTQISDSVQTIPSKLSNTIVAEIRRSVEKWRIEPDNLEAEIFRLMTLQCKEILTDLSHKITDAPRMTKDFINDNIRKR